MRSTRMLARPQLVRPGATRLGVLAAPAALALALTLTWAPQVAEAQVYFGPPVVRVAPPWVRVRPWFRPRIVVVPPIPYYVQPAPPPVYVQPQPYYVQPQPYYGQQPYNVQPQPPLPPPPVYSQPAPPPPVYSQPPAYYQYPPATYARPPQPVRPQWTARVGIGGRFAGIINRDDWTQFGQLGFGGEMLFRVQRHIVLELASEYQRSVYGEGEFRRYDVPVTLGARFHLGGPEWVVSPYLVAAAGLNYANLDYIHARDIAWFAVGQLGGGLEIRLGKHVALTGDVRIDGRRRLSEPDEATQATTFVNGKPFAPMQSQYGGQFRLGAAVYF